MGDISKTSIGLFILRYLSAARLPQVKCQKRKQEGFDILTNISKLFVPPCLCESFLVIPFFPLHLGVTRGIIP